MIPRRKKKGIEQMNVSTNPVELALSFKRILFMSILFMFMIYFITHLKHCTTIEVMTKRQIQALSDEYKNIPEQLILPVKYIYFNEVTYS